MRKIIIKSNCSINAGTSIEKNIQSHQGTPHPKVRLVFCLLWFQHGEGNAAFCLVNGVYPYGHNVTD